MLQCASVVVRLPRLRRSRSRRGAPSSSPSPEPAPPADDAVEVPLPRAMLEKHGLEHDPICSHLLRLDDLSDERLCLPRTTYEAWTPRAGTSAACGRGGRSGAGALGGRKSAIVLEKHDTVQVRAHRCCSALVLSCSRARYCCPSSACLCAFSR